MIFYVSMPTQHLHIMKDLYIKECHIAFSRYNKDTTSFTNHTFTGIYNP